jgi:hypothetical protein
MQNSFEKQVQEKMDELQFVPTEPVWKNIEKQIRTKKDRRRILLWLPLLFLLLGGGIWWLATQNQNKSSIAIIDKKEAIEEKDAHPVLGNPQTGKSNAPAIEVQEKQSPVENKYQQSGGTASSKAPSSPKTRKQKDALNSLSLPAKPIAKASDAEKNITIKEDAQGFNKEGEAVNTKTINKSSQTSQTDSFLYKINTKKDSTAQYKVAEVKADSTNAGAAGISKKQKLPAFKWQLGVLVNAGVSGLAKSFGAFSEEKSLQDAYSAPGNGAPPPVFGPSPVENNLSFSAGVIAKKDLTKRLSFSTGLQYNYYSTNIAVGQMRRQDTTVFSSGFSQSVNRFYLNSANNFNDYKNRYHFISVPVAIDWKILKKAPLHLHAGLSVQQLISTNALLFNQSSQIYYADKKAFNKTQLFSSFALSYAVFNGPKTSLLVGPQLQYGISDLEKNTSGKHLFSLGASVQFLFHKN